MCNSRSDVIILPVSVLLLILSHFYIYFRLLSCAYVSLQPKLLDFGDIDVGNASEQLTIQMTNKGHKNTQFVVDLGRNDLELIVDPMRGMIQVRKNLNNLVTGKYSPVVTRGK